MVLIQRLAATVVSAHVLLGSTFAHSVERNPLNYVTFIDEARIETPSHRAHSHSSFDITFHLHNRRQHVKLSLEPNDNVIADGATVSYLGPDGLEVRRESLNRRDHKVFKGKAWLRRSASKGWVHMGWARIVLHVDGSKPVFEGAFLMMGDHHHIQMSDNYLRTRLAQDPDLPEGAHNHMVLWRDSDVRGNDHLHTELRRDIDEATCSSNALLFNQDPNHPVYAGMRKRETGFWGSISTRSIYGRQIDGQTTGNGPATNLVSTIGSTAGCPTTRKVALIGVATDCTYTADFANSSAARTNIIAQINSASVQYESSFNITLGLRNLTISDANCPGTAASTTPWNIGCSSSVDISDRLNLFSAWRGALGDSVNAYWTLLSKCNTGSAVGLAWLGQACMNTVTSNANETVSSANVVVRTSSEWQVIAHETGHTFGAVHDCTSQTCNDGYTVAAQQCCPLSSSTCDAGQQFIMNPSTGSSITQFSPCTVGNICTAIGSNSVNTQCLTANKDVVTISEAQCGNGIVEAGEDCDCGGTSGCGSNSCCNPTTCKFANNAVCDPSNEDCCTTSCQFAGNGTVCRASTGVCDPAETCSGTSALCPANVAAPDGQSCGTSGANTYCASGQCTSRDAQCLSLMGSISHSNTTYACPDRNDCQVTCQSPAFGYGTCYSLSSYFLDGTSCGGNGRCSNGQCAGSTVGGEISSWVNNNKPLVIGLSAGLGGLVVLLLLSCLINCCRNRSKSRVPAGVKPPIGAPPPYGYGGHNQYNQLAPPPMAYRNDSAGWGPDGRWQGQYGGGATRYA